MSCENSARKRSKTMAFRCTPEERKLICEMAAWSGVSRQDYIIAKLTDAQVEVRIGEHSEGVEGLDVGVVQGGASGWPPTAS